MVTYIGMGIDIKRINATMSKDVHDETDLCELFIFLTSKNKKLKKQSSRIITAIMSDIKVSKLRKINAYFRAKTSMDWTFDWKNYDINELTKGIRNQEEIVNILGLASFHCNGYFREKAIDELCEIQSKSVFPFILIRTNDYVDIIRMKAEKMLFQILNKERFAEIVKFYSLIVMSEQWKHSSFERIMDRLDEIEKHLSVDDVLPVLRLSDAKGRIYCYKILLNQSELSKTEICHMLLTETEYYVKSTVFNLLIEEFDYNQLIEMKDVLHKIKSPAIRAKLIDKLFAYGYYMTQESLMFTLLDRYFRVRNSGLDYILQLGEFDIVNYYYNVLKEEPENTYAICGLCEHGTSDDFKFLKKYIDHNSVQIVGNVLLFITKNECDGYIDILIKHIQDKRIGISNRARRLLIANKHLVNMNCIYDIFNLEEIPHIKENCMLFLCNLSKWDSIPYIIEFAYNEEKDVSRLGKIFLDSWKANFNKTFVQPSKKQIVKINNAISGLKNTTDKSAKNVEYIKFIIKDYQYIK